MNSEWRDFFTLKKYEKIGLMLLSGLFSLIIVVRATDSFSDVSVAPIEVSIKKIDEIVDNSNAISLEEFDPNHLDSLGWLKLEFSPKQVHGILNYRRTGAVFSEKRDLLKLFCVTDKRYRELEPYIILPAKENRTPKKKDVVKVKQMVDINKASVEELKALKHVGEFYAKRIVKFREVLGGFSTVDQLAEVYGLDSSVVLDNLELLHVNLKPLELIGLNSSSVKELQSHPYLDWNLSRAIVQFRDSVGRFESIESIRSVDLVNADIYRKIAPYLKIDSTNL